MDLNIQKTSDEKETYGHTFENMICWKAGIICFENVESMRTKVVVF